MSDITKKPKAGFAPVYCAMYPELAEITKKHGYALAIHGSLTRDFDLVAIPWIELASAPEDVIKDITSTFALRVIGKPTPMEHGRLCWTLQISYGTCFVDFSFMPRVMIQSKEL